MEVGVSEPRFSNEFWREFRMSRPRPLVYGLAALAIGVALLSRLSDAGHAADFQMMLIAAGGIGLSLLPGLFSARRLGSRRAIEALRVALEGLPKGRREAALRSWYRRALLDAALGPGLVMLALVPACILGTAASAGAVRAANLFRLSDPLVSVLLICAELGVSLFVSLAVGAAAARSFRRGASLLPRILTAGVLVARAACVMVGAEVLNPWSMWLFVGHPPPEPVVTLIENSAAVVAASALFWFGIGWLALALGRRGVRRSLRESRAVAEGVRSADDDEMINDRPEGIGLDVSFWSLFTWKFWRDPLYRAEHRHLWRRGRRIALIVCWGAAVLALMLLSKLAWNSRTMAFWGKGVNSLRAWPMHAIILLVMAPFAMAPAVVIFRLSREKREGSLDALVLTPLAPLRICAAKVWGRLAPLCLCALAVVAAQLYWPCSYSRPQYWYGQPAMSWTIMYWYEAYRPIGLALPVFIVPGILAAGAIGSYFAVRLRSAAGAVVASYLTLTVLSLLWLFAWVMLRQSALSPFQGHRRELWAGVAGAVMSVVCMGAVARIFLTEAARRLALRRE